MSATRITVASLAARMDAQDARLDTMVDAMLALNGTLQALIDAQAPAKVTPKPKASPKKAAPKAQPKAAPVRKGAQTRETLSRKDWNRTLTARARFAGGINYRLVLAGWDQAQDLREAGRTPEEAFDILTAGIVA